MAKSTAHQRYGSAVGDAFGEIIRGIDALANVAIRNKLIGLTSPRPGRIEPRRRRVDAPRRRACSVNRHAGLASSPRDRTAAASAPQIG